MSEREPRDLIAELVREILDMEGEDGERELVRRTPASEGGEHDKQHDNLASSVGKLEGGEREALIEELAEQVRRGKDRGGFIALSHDLGDRLLAALTGGTDG